MNRQLKLSMLLTAEASSVKQEAAETRAALDGIGESAEAAGRRSTAASTGAAAASREAAAANDAVSVSARRAVEAQHAQVAAEERLVATINRRLNVGRVEPVGTPFAGDASRGRDVAAYGAELDRLRARYNPLYAEIRRYQTAQAEIRNAHAVGAISTAEMTAAIGRERSASLESIAALKGRSAALIEAAAAQRTASQQAQLIPGGNNSFATANVAAQFQDIGVTTAMGMSPLQIALQQGTQLSAVLNTMERPVHGLASAFLSVINPVSLVTIGVIAAGSAAVQYFMEASEGAETADAALEAHRDNIGSIREKWGEAGSGVETYVQKSRLVLQGENRRIGQTLEQELGRLTEGLLGNTDIIRTDYERIAAEIEQVTTRMVTAVGDDALYAELSAQLEKLWVDLENAAEGARVATERFAPLRKEIEDFIAGAARGEPNFIALENAINRAFFDNEADEGIGELVDSISSLIEEGAELQRNMLASKNALSGLGETAQQQVKGLNEAAAALGRLQQMGTPELTGVARQRAEARAEFMKALGSEDRIIRENARPAYEALLDRIRVSQMPIPTTRPNIEMEPLPRSGRGGGGADKVSDFDRQIEQISARTRAMEIEASAIGMSVYEREKLIATERLLQAAQSDSEGVSAKRLAAIEAETSAYAQQVAAMEEIRETDRRIQEGVRFRNDILAGTMDSIRRAGRDGKLELEDLGDIAINILDRIAQRIQDVMLDQNFNGGGGGSIWGILAQALGFGGGATFASMNAISPGAARVIAAGGGGLFAKGGISDRPAIFGEAGPEAAVPLPDGRSIPVSLRMQGNGAPSPVSIKFEVVDRAGVQVEAGQPQQGANGEMMMPLIIKQIEDAMVSSMNSGRLGNATRSTFGLGRRLR
ncbi:phage tail length tape measure family protein [Aliihoeflea sp. PC F10.4]